MGCYFLRLLITADLLVQWFGPQSFSQHVAGRTVESTEGVSQILVGREFSRWAPSPFGVTVSFA